MYQPELADYCLAGGRLRFRLRAAAAALASIPSRFKKAVIRV